MAWLVLGIVLGAVLGALLAVRQPDVVNDLASRLRLLPARAGRARPDFAREVLNDIRDDAPDIAEVLAQPPAVEPESVPESVAVSTINSDDVELELGRTVHDKDLLRFLLALKGWEPKDNRGEQYYQRDLFKHVTRRSAHPLSKTEFVQWPGHLTLQLGEDEGKVVPDYLMNDRLLVEIKADVWSAAETDRALGQVIRYLLMWKGKGPALLMICGYCRPVYRALIRIYVSIWRRHLKIPVTVFFLRDEAPDDVRTSVDPEAWNEQDVSEN